MTLEELVPLAKYSTLHVGGTARYFVRVTRKEDLQHALTWAGERAHPWCIIGGGANFFCRDAGFPGLVIKMENRALSFDNNEMTAEAGVLTRIGVRAAVERGFRGMERLAGIPGTMGGAVRGNAGAFGMETSRHLTRVHVLERTARGWEENIVPREQLFFAYRDSTFKREQGRFAIWSATFSLPGGNRAEGERLVDSDLAERKKKQPYEFPSVGSVFKNPAPETPAGHLIESAGLKGLRAGGAEVSTKHANFIVNRGGATASDVLSLIAEIKKRVRENFGVDLEEEIVIL